MKKLLSIAVCFFCGVHGLSAQATAGVPFNGLVTDADGKGIKARIMVRGNGNYTVADKKGQFGLTDITPSDTLVLTYKRNTLVVPVAGRRSLKVVWVDDNPRYEEDEALADYGYGYVKRREHASSSSGISGEEMVRRGYTDLQSAILAMVPGVQLINGEIAIRGVGSINSGNAALVVCDGIAIGSLNSINIHDVKSVEVLKGSNMYGLRGGNGVILIRTRGK